MLSRFELLLNTVVRIRRKENVILQNAPHRTPKWPLHQKCQQSVLSKIREYWIDVRCALSNWNQEVNSYQLQRKISPETSLKILFFIESTKNICFYPNRKMVNSYTFASSRIKSKSLDSTIDKRKHLCIPYTARKNDIFIKKSQKYSFLT